MRRIVAHVLTALTAAALTLAAVLTIGPATADDQGRTVAELSDQLEGVRAALDGTRTTADTERARMRDTIDRLTSERDRARDARDRARDAADQAAVERDQAYADLAAAPEPAPAPVTWHGFTVGDVIVCDGGAEPIADTDNDGTPWAACM
jgi:Spy/CpxP family protein refolding chaperone